MEFYSVDRNIKRQNKKLVPFTLDQQTDNYLLTVIQLIEFGHGIISFSDIPTNRPWLYIAFDSGSLNDTERREPGIPDCLWSTDLV